MELSDSVLKIKGIGAKTGELYQKLGIVTVRDLLWYVPKRYESYDPEVPIGTVRDGQLVTVHGMFATSPKVIRTGRGTLLVARFRDSSGELTVKWFNQEYLRGRLTPATHMMLRGKIVRDRKETVMLQPELYTPEKYRLLMKSLRPIYGLTAGITTNAIAKSVTEALASCDIPDPVKPALRKQYGLMKLKDALTEVHFPKSGEVTREGIKRLAYDELVQFLSSVRAMKQQTEEEPNRYPVTSHEWADRLIAGLPYQLTGAQANAYGDILRDLSGLHPMQRLLQGDVGSGKTVVAELAILTMAENGWQSCLMVPTEVLARQHFTELTKQLEPFGITVGLLTGSQTAAEKRTVKTALALGAVQVVVGTHAMFTESVQFAKLGLAVVDEQHRFGVEQRRKLQEKGSAVHVLMMSATPIPRTLAMMLYADLDLTVLNEMPRNRRAVKTCVVNTAYRPTAYKFLTDRIAAGEQCYVICPLIEESEGSDSENVIDYAQRLRTELPETVTVGVLHGKMNPKEKNAVMTAFAAKEYNVLVSTTVIEVGIDVANATVILIENAERFGLASLHQLRGRVGRGALQSYCILIQGTDSEESKARLSVMLNAKDGFAIAEEDLKLRGPGDFFGIRQSGEFAFRLADPIRDAESLAAAKETVEHMTDGEVAEVLADRVTL